jgi:hypothetical protein
VINEPVVAVEQSALRYRAVDTAGSRYAAVLTGAPRYGAAERSAPRVQDGTVPGLPQGDVFLDGAWFLDGTTVLS